MDKILISWVAVQNDFDKETGTAVMTGPTFRFHQYFYEKEKYKKHIILSDEGSIRSQNKSQKLAEYLSHYFDNKHEIEIRNMDLGPGGVINFNEIHPKIITLLKEFRDYNIDIFVSPGTPTMQVVWHIAKIELNQPIRLLQSIAPEYSASNKPELLEINLENSSLVSYYLTKENQINKEKTGNNDSDFFRPDSLQPVLEKAALIAQTDKTTVLIRGGSGSGKEGIAFEIKKKSTRKSKPYIMVNCASIGNDLLESRLFGHKKGAFTDAYKDNVGFFEAANQGTIFLDEIGDISNYMQASLLRVLENQQILPVGATEPVDIDVRVITATNKDLYKECEEGRFRWDLYYRLAISEIEIPPLISWKTSEVKSLIGFCNEKLFKNLKISKEKLNFSHDCMEALLNHTWPGNIRELSNLIEGLYTLGTEKITYDMLPARIKNNRSKNSLLLDEVIKNHVQQTVDLCNGNKEKARTLLGLGSVNTVNKYLG